MNPSDLFVIRLDIGDLLILGGLAVGAVGLVGALVGTTMKEWRAKRKKKHQANP